MEIEHPKRSLWESILLVVIFVAILAFVVQSFFQQQKSQKAKALFYQLALIRQGVNLFYLVEKRYPEHLVELAVKTYEFPDENLRRPYIERLPVNDDGLVIDPFGNPYGYFKDNGRVMSTTPAHATW